MEHGTFGDELVRSVRSGFYRALLGRHHITFTTTKEGKCPRCDTCLQNTDMVTHSLFQCKALKHEREQYLTSIEKAFHTHNCCEKTFKYFKNTLTHNPITQHKMKMIRIIAFGGGAIQNKKHGVRVCQGPKNIQMNTSSMMAVLTALFLQNIQNKSLDDSWLTAEPVMPPAHDAPKARMCCVGESVLCWRVCVVYN